LREEEEEAAYGREREREFGLVKRKMKLGLREEEEADVSILFSKSNRPCALIGPFSLCHVKGRIEPTDFECLKKGRIVIWLF
jgi:hypothetical protein